MNQTKLKPVNKIREAVLDYCKDKGLADNLHFDILLDFADYMDTKLEAEDGE